MNWILLRGLGRDKKHWYTFPKKLEQAIEGKVICLNFPGMGNEDNPPIKIQEITDYLRKEFLRIKQSYEGPWSILAISLGGMVAIDWSARYPNDFQNLVTINSSSKTTSKFYERIRPSAILTLLKCLAAKNSRQREKQILEITNNHFKITKEVLDHWEKIADDINLNYLTVIKQLIAASAFKLPNNLDTNYIVLNAKGDRFTHHSCSENIAIFYNTKLVSHPTAGHDLPNDDPDFIIKAIKEYQVS